MPPAGRRGAGSGGLHRPADTAARAWVRLPSGRRLDLLAPTPFDWTDEDLAVGLSRTFRWGGHSTWPGAPLSVAQHSLAVLALRRARAKGGLTQEEARRELLHDAEEGLLGFDCISPLKPFLGPGFAALQDRLSAVVALRYALPAWTPETKRAHKACDIALAAAEAVHVAGWTREEVRGTLGIRAAVMADDPLAAAYDSEPWRPWPPEVAAERFLMALKHLTTA
ncbi:phosphohydrolase [Dankookia sp. GCM10030260]|uniref:phosphohydrolase n=1 Tax=Dankookia sp. GCM10030260 TaxID=3273390 RepID=UPI003616F5B3